MTARDTLHAFLHELRDATVLDVHVGHAAAGVAVYSGLAERIPSERSRLVRGDTYSVRLTEAGRAWLDGGWR